MKQGRPENGADFGGSGEAREVAARKFNVGRSAVDEAEQVLEAAPELFERVVEGESGLREAQRETAVFRRKRTCTENRAQGH